MKVKVELNRKLDEFSCRKEETWKQKSGELWLREQDRNTKFFHSSTINRRKNNKIEEIENKA